MNRPDRPRFALTAVEWRTLLVLAALLLIGLIAKQVDRRNVVEQPVVIEGAHPLTAQDSMLANSDDGVDSETGSGSLDEPSQKDVPSTLSLTSPEKYAGDTAFADSLVKTDAQPRVSHPVSGIRDGRGEETSEDYLRTEESNLADEASASAGKIELNRATAADLEALPGIGPVLASRIIEWRQKHERFTRLEDLMLVRGIGEKRFETLKTYAYVSKEQ